MHNADTTKTERERESVIPFETYALAAVSSRAHAACMRACVCMLAFAFARACTKTSDVFRGASHPQFSCKHKSFKHIPNAICIAFCLAVRDRSHSSALIVDQPIGRDRVFFCLQPSAMHISHHRVARLNGIMSINEVAKTWQGVIRGHQCLMHL